MNEPAIQCPLGFAGCARACRYPCRCQRASDDAIESRLDDLDYGDSYDDARMEGLAVRS